MRDKSKHAANMRAWRKKNPEAVRAIEARRNKTQAQRSAEWRAKNPERHKILRKRHYEKNKSKFIARNQTRRAISKNATPKWLTHEQRLAFARFYETRPEGHHVDHIVPLRGKTVCGLNVPWNLQHLPANENLKKNNKV